MIQMNDPKLALTDSELAIISNHAPSVKSRARIELAIVKRILVSAFDCGFQVSIDDGDNDWQWMYASKLQDALEACFAVDECTISLRAWNDDQCKWKYGCIQLVFGNDGFDVINDYHLNLELFLYPISEYADQLANGDTVAL